MPYTTSDSFDHLNGSGRIIAAAASRPARIVYAAIAIAVVTSWTILLAMGSHSAAVLGDVASGPGGQVLRILPDFPIPDYLEAFLAQCLMPGTTAISGISGFFALTAMWFIMALAMMLPSAAPLIRTYCEIADTAVSADKHVVHPAVLFSGYLAVWMLAAIGFAGISVVLTSTAFGGQTVASPVTNIAAAFALVLAGAYQFTNLKDVCLTKCRNPFATLFANWRTDAAGVFRLGIEQGLYCLGCCWALMLVMFAVGTMNVFWMALLAVFSVFEKNYDSKIATRLAGSILLVWALILLIMQI